MSEKTDDKTDQEPAPIKDSDANRVTSEETERASKGREQDSAEDSDQSPE
jgi:hypothetical protein